MFARPATLPLLAQNLDKFSGEASRGSKPRLSGIESPQRALNALTEMKSLCQHCVEYWGEVARRGVDDPQHLGGGGLLFQCLARLGEEPRILHRDDRLRREVFDEGDLFVGKRLHLLPKKGQDSRDGTVFGERDAEGRAAATEIDQSASVGLARLVKFGGGDIGELHIALTARDTGKPVTRSERHLIIRNVLHERFWPADGDESETFLLPSAEPAKGSPAQMHRPFEHRVEDRLELTGRGIDDLQYLGRRGLLLQ